MDAKVLELIGWGKARGFSLHLDLKTKYYEIECEEITLKEILDTLPPAAFPVILAIVRFAYVKCNLILNEKYQVLEIYRKNPTCDYGKYAWETLWAPTQICDVPPGTNPSGFGPGNECDTGGSL